MRLLIIDDEQVNIALLQGILGEAGFFQVMGVDDSREALQAMRDWRPDLILLDLMMPWVDGYQLLEQFRVETASDVFMPVMVLTADVTESAKRRALLAGANDFLFKPINNTECLLRIGNLLRTRRLHLQIRAYNAGLQERVRERTSALETTLVELRVAQKQIVQRERLSALGAMISGVGHDFSNSLALIIAYGERLQHACRVQNVGGEVAECAHTIVTAALEASDTVARLRAFHRGTGPEDHYQPVDLQRLVQQAVAFTRPRWETESSGRGSPILCQCELDPTPPVNGSAAELREMLTNLIFNAVDAMPQGGYIRIRTSFRANRIVLDVRDEGCGMSEEVKRRCFEPFFTTKRERASGLGLAMVYGVVQRHAATIQIQSRPGWGTTFTLTFPADTSGTEPATTETSSPSRPLRILLVDDQPVLNELVAEMLARDWHQVTTALDGASALEKFKNADFDLVITDKAMPEMNGDQLAAAIKSRAPEVPVLMLTGFGDLVQNEEECSEFVDGVLAKPATSAELRGAIGKLFSRTGLGKTRPA